MKGLFAWRYFISKKSTNAINIIAWISVLAIVVGTASLIVVLSVFNGFEGLVKQLYASFYSDIRVVSPDGKTIQLNSQQIAALRATPGVKALSLVWEEKALLQHGDYQTIVYLKGVDSQYAQVTGVAEKVQRGSFETGTASEPRLVLGAGIEHALAIQADRAITPVVGYLPRRGVSLQQVDPLQALSAGQFYTTGVFVIQQDFDNKYAITDLEALRSLMGAGTDEYGAAEIKLTSAGAEKEVQQAIRAQLGKAYQVQTRYEQNQSLYAIMQMEKWVIYALLCLILIVAAFTMIGSLTMLVLEKRKDIQLLKAMGMRNEQVQGIFLSEGVLLAGLGGLAGLFLALLICWLQRKFKLIALEGGTFIIDAYPVKVVWTDILLVLSTVLLVALIAAWIPSKRAAAEPMSLRS
jgi:lipoprotein-releasing system permease protein